MKTALWLHSQHESQVKLIYRYLEVLIEKLTQS
jgi:hypothetical protein